MVSGALEGESLLLKHSSTSWGPLHRPRRVRRKRSVPERLHYSDDGYTSDPGLLREEPKELHDEVSKERE